jgi:hypothetical protein
MKTKLILSVLSGSCLALFTHAQTTPCNSLGPELVQNGDFTGGNTVFSSGYAHFNGCATGGILGNGLQGGTYNVRQLGTGGSFCYGILDRNSGNGFAIHYPDVPNNFAGIRMWGEQVTVAANSNYIFSFYAYEPAGNSGALPNGTRFEVWINNILIQATDVGGYGSWINKTYTWPSPATGGNIWLEIRTGTGNPNQPGPNGGTTGMDPLFDGFSFRKCESDNNCCLGNLCTDSQNPLSGDYEIPLNGHHFNFSGDSEVGDKVNVGYTCGSSGLGKLNSTTHWQTNTTGSGPESIAIYGHNTSNEMNFTKVGVMGYTDGVVNRNWHLGVAGVARPTTGIQPAYNFKTVYSNGATIGVYGAGEVNNTGPTSTPGPDWAGWFDGDVNIYGSGWFNTSWTWSDNRLKKDVKGLENVTDKIKRLNGYTYGFKTEEFKTRGFDNRTHIGFIAQEVKEVFPELVREDVKGFLAVDYEGMIPVLLEAIKSQQQQIDALNALVSGTDGKRTDALVTPVTLSDSKAIVLNQNVPNPFAESTVITYNIPTDFMKAQIIFSDSQGIVIKVVEITSRGKGTLNVFADDLTHGVYSYALIVDGKNIDSKKMIRQ